MLRTLLLILFFVGNGAALATDADPELREVLRAAASESPSFVDRFHAEVWLTDMSARLARQVRDPEERIELLRLGVLAGSESSPLPCSPRPAETR